VKPIKAFIHQAFIHHVRAPVPGSRSPASAGAARRRVVVAALALLSLGSATAWHTIDMPVAHGVSLVCILLA